MSALATHIPRTLIADDQPDVLVALRLLLKNAGYQTESANSPQAVLEAVKKREFDVALIDLNYARDTTSGQEGLDLISRIQAEDKSLPIVVMTAWGTVDLAVEAMQRGVRDFVQKPWENSRLLQVLRTQIDQGRALRQLKVRASQTRARHRALRNEFREAREIQRCLMPDSATYLDGFEISCSWSAAHTIGGDYLAAFPLDDGRAALCVADVSGKGVPAALLMSNLQAALKSKAAFDLAPGDLCEQLNQLMCGNLPANKFITCFYGLLDTRRRTLQYTNAGHNPPLLLKANGELSQLQIGGRVLGAFSDSHYQQDAVQLQSGDRLLLFTDGITEVRNPAGQEFGEQRLLQLVRRARTGTVTELKELIMNSVGEFCGNDFEDDAALMVVTAC
jgi:sigma-B regulation protein RsbU (phosphoserine phosphatase)